MCYVTRTIYCTDKYVQNRLKATTMIDDVFSLFDWGSKFI